MARSTIATWRDSPAFCIGFAALCSVAFWAGGVQADHGETPQPVGLAVDAPFSDHVHRHFRVREGLPSNWVYDLTQTKDGYVWIATSNGIARFDGLRFEVFRRSNTPQIPANDTRVLYESRDGALWIGTVGGLVSYRPGRPGLFASYESFAGNSVHAIFQDNKGDIWLGTREKTWVKGQASNEFKVVEAAPSDVKAICQDAKGDLWFGTDSSLFRMRGVRCERVDHPRYETLAAGTDNAPSVRALLAAGNGVWVGCSHGLLRITEDGFADDGKEIGQVRCNELYRTRDGAIYLATSSGLYRSVDSSPFVMVRS